ncbi:MAG: hypothetical protein HDR38_08295 [Treponema sp.]|nr:hypothetical protein [Treponema sp.]
MKNKILFGVNSFFLAAVLVSLFMPIDGKYVYVINLGLGILSFIFILVTFCIKREKQFIFLSLFQLALLLFWYVMIGRHYSLYKIGWKLYVSLLISPIAFSHFFLARQIFPKKRALYCFIVLLSFIFVKNVFFTQFYEFEGRKEYGEDIRDYPNHRQYKVLNERKLKNKKPVKLVDEDFSAIASLINNSDWLKDNYPECVGDFPDYVDISYIKKNIKYSFSVIHFYEFDAADFYKISIPLKKSRKKVNVYFPKGKFGLFKEGLEAYKKYYGVSPKEISTYYYEGLGIPYNQDEYESYIED